MEQSVGSTIEKIKLQEQDIEARLKDKRECNITKSFDKYDEAALSSLNRAIRKAIVQTEKSEKEQLEIENRIKKLRPQLEIEKLKCDALLKQINTFTTVLEDLRALSDKGITKVWNLRSSLCDKVHNVSDECDIWALLMRPMLTDPLPQVITKNDNNDNNDIVTNNDRLKAALERRKKATVEREKLLGEPEAGEEFIRIKNALQYSIEKIAYLKK